MVKGVADLAGAFALMESRFVLSRGIAPVELHGYNSECCRVFAAIVYRSPGVSVMSARGNMAKGIFVRTTHGGGQRCLLIAGIFGGGSQGVDGTNRALCDRSDLRYVPATTFERTPLKNASHVIVGTIPRLHLVE